jgi:BCD family chlorophyll transporter-like MFS transporter
MADALARLLGAVLSGAVRDLVAAAAHGDVIGYIVVFLIQAGLLAGSLFLLRRVDISAFRRQAGPATLVERTALAGEA